MHHTCWFKNAAEQSNPFVERRPSTAANNSECLPNSFPDFVFFEGKQSSYCSHCQPSRPGNDDHQRQPPPPPSCCIFDYEQRKQNAFSSLFGFGWWNPAFVCYLLLKDLLPMPERTGMYVCWCWRWVASSNCTKLLAWMNECELKQINVSENLAMVVCVCVEKARNRQ